MLVDPRRAPEASGTDVVLYGFGRIGRLLARLLIEKAGGGHGLRLRAIVVRRGSDNDLVKRASLLRRDSVHGPFEGTIKVDEENEHHHSPTASLIQVIYSNNPATIDYTAYGIHDALVVDNTGRWRDAEGLSQHLQSKGVSRVLLTAPGKGELKNIVHGINHDDHHRLGHDRLGGLLHHQRHHPGAQGDQRPLRRRARPRRDGPLVHERPEPDRQLPQGRPPRPLGRAEHGHHRDRCRQGRRQGAARTRGQAHRQRHPRPDARTCRWRS